MRFVRGLPAVAYPFAIFAALRWLEPRWDPRALLLVPVLISTGLLMAFGRTLWRGASMVETLARLREPHLSDAQVRHCRTVTAVWCGFFAVNAAVCLALALYADLWLWTLYTGVVSYALMGLLFAAELVVRNWRFHNFSGAFARPLLQRLFPQGPSA
jgi:uncharacterized membrane protein